MAGPPLYEETVARLLFDPLPPARHYLHGHDRPTEEIPIVGKRSDDEEGYADDWRACLGEDRADPDSWDDPDIIDEPWDAPAEVDR